MKKLLMILLLMSGMLFFTACGGSNTSSNKTDEDSKTTDNMKTEQEANVEQEAQTNDEDSVTKNDSAETENVVDSSDLDTVDTTDSNEIQDEDIVVPNVDLKKKFVGVWAEKLSLKSDTDSPVGKVHSTTWRYRLEKITIGTDGELHTNTQLCKITNYTTSSMTKGKTIFPQKFCETYHFWHPYELSTKKPDISVSENNGKISFVENKSWELRGMKKMQNVETDKMPTDKNDSRIIDQDKDGHPGFTISFVGEGLSPSGDIYFVQKLGHELTATKIVEKNNVATRIEGGATWSDAEFNIDATNKLLKGNRTTTTLPSSFVFIRMKDSATCDDIYDLKNNKEKISFK